jgi:hypothetical protein
MPVIDSKYVEIEIQQQTIEGAARHWCVMLKYEPTEHKSCEIANIVLTDFDPIVRWTKHTNDAVINMNNPDRFLTSDQKDIMTLENDVRLYKIQVDQLKQEIAELKNVKNN